MLYIGGLQLLIIISAETFKLLLATFSFKMPNDDSLRCYFFLRATSPSGGFILLLYTPLNKQPLFFECQRRDNNHNLTFDLIGCKEQLHMYKVRNLGQSQS